MGLASFKLFRNVKRLGCRFGSDTNSVVPLVNQSQNAGVASALRVRANAVHDVGIKNTLLEIASVFDKIESGE
jgi:hypothetical protein